MLARIRKSMEEHEEGFTLVELLVVVVIIGILAAIAIPTFLNQREKAWQRESQSDLRNSATVMETFFGDNGTYVGEVATAFKVSDDDTLTIKSQTATAYCIDVNNAKLTTATIDYHFDSTVGKPATGACP